jgi:hypothetical protein
MIGDLLAELSDDALVSAVGGMMNLREYAPKAPPDEDGAGGPQHPGDDRFSILWPHGY